MSFSKTFNVVLLSTIFILMSFNTIPSKLKKKVDKEVKATFSTESFTFQVVSVKDAVNVKLQKKIKENTLFKILSDSELIGYAYVDKAPSKTDEFDYLVLFDTAFIIKKTKVLVYREDYGGEIGSKRWLKQFNGKTCKDKLAYEKDIIAISGATISANSMTLAVNNLLHSINILQEHKAI